MEVIYWMIFGLVVGSIADYLSPSASLGMLGSILLGVLGAVIGGYLGQRIFGLNVTGFNFISIMLSVAGSLLLLAAVRLFPRG